MIPKKEVITISNKATKASIKKTIINTGHTRFPVVNAEGEVTGIFNANFFMKDAMSDKKFAIQRSIYESIFFKETENAADAMTMMRNERIKMAIVVSKHNPKKMVGIITMEDIVEEVVGELYDESDREEDGILNISEGHFVVRWDAIASEVIKDVWNMNSSKYITKEDMTFPDFLKAATKVESLEEGQHIHYKNSIIWVKKDKKTSRADLSFEIDIIENEK